MWRTLEISLTAIIWRREGALRDRRERLARVVRTTKTVRGKRYPSYYVKIDIPERLAEKVEAYKVRIEEETGRITLEPIYRREQKEDKN